MIARCLDVELHSLVPFFIDGFVFAMPGATARMNSTPDSCLCGDKTYPQKKRIDRYGLRLEQVQRVVAICVELAGLSQNVKTKMLQTFHGTWEAKEEFVFASPLHFTGSFSCPHSRGISGRSQAL